MKIKIVSDRYNALLRRREIALEVYHPGRPSPTRAEVRKALASLLGKSCEVTYIIRMVTKTGTHVAVGEAEIYDAVEDALAILPKHIIERHKRAEGAEGAE